jgi:hypothetical protein
MALTPRLELPGPRTAAQVDTAVTAVRDALAAAGVPAATVGAARHGDRWVLAIHATPSLHARDAAYAWLRDSLGAGKLLERGRVAVHLCSHAQGERDGVEHCRTGALSAFAETVA